MSPLIGIERHIATHLHSPMSYKEAGRSKEADVSHCGWLDLITVYSLIWNGDVEQMVPLHVVESGGICHELQWEHPDDDII